MNDLSLEPLFVCAGSSSIFGPLVRGSVAYAYQACRWYDCPHRSAAWHQPSARLRSPGPDLEMQVELCLCCAAVPIDTGSRFSSFFCGVCGPRVDVLDNALGLAAIPRGRHSFVNGVAMRGDRGVSREQIEAFAAATTSLFARIDRLSDWRRTVVRDRIEAMSGPSTEFVALPAYLDFAAGELPPAAMFRQLVQYMGIDDAFGPALAGVLADALAAGADD